MKNQDVEVTTHCGTNNIDFNRLKIDVIRLLTQLLLSIFENKYR